MSEHSNAREWALEAETEYRFELDPGTSLAIKVDSTGAVVQPPTNPASLSVVTQKSLVPNLQRAILICSGLNAKQLSLLGMVVQ